MAQINYYDDIFDTVSKTEFCNSDDNLRTLIENYIERKGDNAQLLEVYNCETDETSYKVVTVESYKVSVLVNGEESFLEYEIKEDDLISVIFIPQSSGADGGALIGTGIGLFIASVLTMGIGAIIGGTPGIICAAVGLVGVGGSLALIYNGVQLENEKKKSNDDQKDKQKLFSVNGSQNQSIIGNRYPLILGKTLITPYIAGYPYHITHVKDIETGAEGKKGQEFHILYCAGYGPLKLSNLRLGEHIVAYNGPSASGDRSTVLHGMLKGCDDGRLKKIGDITEFYKRNDIEIEILQAGDRYNKLSDDSKYELSSEPYSASQTYYKFIYGNFEQVNLTAEEYVTDKYYVKNSNTARLDPLGKYGVNYNWNVAEKEIDANILFVHDKTLEEAEGQSEQYVQYKGIALVDGFRGNTVRFSSGCPLQLEVELDMPDGYFAAYSVDGKTKYKKVPLNLAVQWRLATPDEVPSDAKSPEGWNDFDCMVFDDSEGGVPPTVYTESMRNAEVSSNKGLSKNTDKNYNKSWIGAKVFSLTSGTWTYRNMTNQEISNALVNKQLTSTDQHYSYTVRKNLSYYPYVKNESYTQHNTKYSITDNTPANIRVITTHDYTKNFDYTTPQILYEDDSSKSGESDSYNINERRYVFRKTFSNEDCLKMVNFDGSTNYLDNIEVRVLRITPCYIDESAKKSDSTISAESYSDLTKWTYLRTWKFNKIKFVRELNKAKDEGRDPASIHAWDYPERPCPEEDLNKFCFISIKAKQDIANTVGNTFNRFTCIAEAFQPNYIEYKHWDGNVRKDWYPENINEIYKYFHKTKNVNGHWEITEISKSEYEENVKIDSVYYWKQRKGTDFSDQVRNEVFNDGSAIEVLTSETDNLDVRTRFVITDKLQRRFITNNSASAGILALVGQHMGQFGKTYDSIDKEIFADAYEYYRDITDGHEQKYSGLPSNLIPETKLNATDFSSILKTDEKSVYVTLSSKNYKLATFNGSNAGVSCKRYIEVLKAVHKHYFNTANKDFYTLVKTWPVNAVHSDIYKDELYLLLEQLNLRLCRYDYLITILEQMECFAPSDGLLHVSYKCNGAVTKEIKLENLLGKIFLTARSYVKRSDDNKWAPLIGRPNPYPVTVLSQRNCIPPRSNSRSFEEPPSGLLVTLVDETDNYGQNEFYVMDEGELPESPTRNIESIGIDYVTDKNQMLNLVTFNLAARLYQREMYTRTVGIIGHTFTLGDTVLLQDDSLLIGTDNASRIIQLIEDNDYIYGFVCDEPFEYTGETDSSERSVQGCTIVQPNKYQQSRCVTLRMLDPDSSVTCNGMSYKMCVGLTNLVLFDNKIVKASNHFLNLTEDVDLNGEVTVVKPGLDNLVTFGKVSVMNTKAVIMAIRPKDNDKFELTLAPYNEDLYRSGSGFPIFSSNMTRPSEGDSLDLNNNITLSELYEKSNDLLSVNNSYLEIESLDGFIFKKNEDGYEPKTITLHVKKKGDISNVTWYKDGESLFNYDDTLVITPDETGVYSIRGDGGYFDSTSIVKIEDGSSFTIICDNESISIPTDNNVELTEDFEADVSFRVFIGTDELDAGTDFSLNIPSSAYGLKLSKPTPDVLRITSEKGSKIKKLTTVEVSVILGSKSFKKAINITAAIQGKQGGYQDYIFAVGDFNLSQAELMKLNWYDAPPDVTDESPCLYMATKWVEGT